MKVFYWKWNCSLRCCGCCWGKCDLWQGETFIIKGTSDSAFPCRSVFLVIPISSQTHPCLFFRMSSFSMTALCSMFSHQEGRLPGRKPLRESWMQPHFPSAASRLNPSPILLSPSINGSGSWEPWLIHHSTPYFPSGHRLESNIFFLAFSSFQSMSRCIDSFFFCCPWVRVFLTHLPWAIAGLLGVFRAELHSSNASNTSRQAPR